MSEGAQAIHTQAGQGKRGASMFSGTQGGSCLRRGAARFRDAGVSI